MRTSRALLAWPALLYLAVLFLVPAGIILAVSVLQRDYHGGVIPNVSWEAWRMATDHITFRALGRTLGLAASVTLLNLVVGYPCAAALARLPVAWRQGMIFVFCFPLITSLLLRTYGWMNLLPESWLGGTLAVALVMSVNYLPFMVLPLLRSLERADPSLVPAALDLGATPWQAFWRVTFPVTRGGMGAGAALVFIPVMGEYLVPHFIGEGKVSVLGTVIWKEFESRNWPYAAACAAWLVGLVLLLVVISAARDAVARREADQAAKPSDNG